MIILKIKNKSKEQGITLIALVITIIVLLILAGVTINLTLKDGGIFSRAKIAAQNYMEAQERELEELGKFENTVNDTINNVTLRISDKEGLEDFASKVNEGKSFEGETIVLESDITLEENWTPIGSEEHPFAGIFDGGGHKINNLTINSEVKNTGLFGYSTGTIKNIGIESGKINGKTFTGAICGTSTGLIEGAYNKANITCNEGNDQACTGGIVGLGAGQGSVRNCLNEGKVQCSIGEKKYSYTGGIMGGGIKNTVVIGCHNAGSVEVNVTGCGYNPMVSGVTTNCGTISCCYNTGELKLIAPDSSCPALGGICAQSGKGSVISNCFSIGRMSYEVENSTSSGRYGYISGYAVGRVNNCFYQYINDANCNKGVAFYYRDGDESVDTTKDEVSSVDEINNWKDKLTAGSDGNFVNNGKDYPILYWEEE